MIGKAGTFLLETKNLAGAITLEAGILVAREVDDSNEVYRYIASCSRPASSLASARAS